MRSNAEICPVTNARYATRVWPCDGQKRQKKSRWSDFHRLLPLSCERFYIVRSNFSLRSILTRKQYCRHASIRLGENPNPITSAGGIHRQNAKPLLD